MDIVIARNEAGGILSKTIKFKNYTGQDNYACFRYGVNLQDIQRTFESKQLATKLIVKQNNNQLGKNGFCTIARAGSNPTGENYIYDFGYFHKTDLLDETQYQA
jgi:phage minor structural protein